jgi:hypothetical protein
MSWLRPFLAVLMAIVWFLAPPLAVASDCCMAMGVMCEGPCGTISGAVSGPDGVAYVRSPMPTTPPPTEHVRQAALRVAEPPPKPVLRSA